MIQMEHRVLVVQFQTPTNSSEKLLDRVMVMQHILSASFFFRKIPDPFCQLKEPYAATLSSLNTEGTLDCGILIYN